MKSFFNITLLSCLLPVFALGDDAMGQEWVGDLYYSNTTRRTSTATEAATWTAVYSNISKRWYWKQTDGSASAPTGRNQRLQSSPSRPPDRLLPTTPPPPQQPPTQNTPPPPRPPQQIQPPRQQNPLTGTPIDPTRGKISNPTRGGSVNTPREFRLTPGDVILTVNGEAITGKTHFTSVVNRSPQTMYFTVRDGRTGRIMNFVTQLSSTGYRFGVTHRDNPGGGARVVQVDRNSPATHCFLVE